MHTISLVSQKGGVGKSTLSIHLAVAFAHAGYNTCLLDLDPQSSVAEWGDARELANPFVKSVNAARLSKEIDGLAQEGADVVILDTAPHAETAAMDAIRISDLVLVPFQPSIMDIRAMNTTVKMLGLVPKVKAYAVLNGVQHHSLQAAEEAATTIATHLKLPVAPLAFGERVAFSRCLITGQAAQEIDPSGKAANEVDIFFQWVRKQLDQKKAAA